MYRKKELIIGAVLLLFVIVGYCFLISYTKNKPYHEDEESIVAEEPIKLHIEGELDRCVDLIFLNPISYANLFMKLSLIMNEYSDISSFKMEEMISKSCNITIPTKDYNNQYSSKDRIDIHHATASDLMKLPQIGEKRAKKILDYISANGNIDSWETFFKIASIPEHAKEQIKKQAFL